MNQAPTPHSAAEPLPLAAPAPAPPTAASSRPPGFSPASPERPAPPRGRYWEQLDPASHSLYPVD